MQDRIQAWKVPELLRGAMAAQGMKPIDVVRVSGHWKNTTRGVRRLGNLLAGTHVDARLTKVFGDALGIPEAEIERVFNEDARRRREEYAAWYAKASEPVTPTCFFEVPVLCAWIKRDLPPGLNREEVIAYVRTYAVTNEMRVAVQVYSGMCMMVHPDGRESNGVGSVSVGNQTTGPVVVS
jgi:hypothetical protein